MKLESQVTSLEISQRLKELGAKQESLFWWIVNFETEQVFLVYKTDIGFYQSNGGGYEPRKFKNLKMYSAFTVAELGEMLPQVLNKDDKLYYLQCNANGNSLRYMDYTTYDKNGNGTFLRAYPLVGADTEADARGKMLIYLLENKLI